MPSVASASRLPVRVALAALLAATLALPAGAFAAPRPVLVVATQSPASGATVSNDVTWQVTVSGSIPSRVEFAVDGVVKWRSAASPYLFGRRTAGLDTSTLRNGAHTFAAVAYGDKGVQAGSTRVTVTVANAVAQQLASTTTTATTTTPNKLYWGARIDGEVYGRADAPWDSGTWNLFEAHAGKRVSLVHFGQPAPWNQAFTRAPFDFVTARGAIPYMTMSSGAATLASIASGAYDTSLVAWARAVKAYGKPFLFRWNREMNGTWYSWGAQAKADPAAYVAAWRHFHDIVQREGATNVTWVWCPNAVWSSSTPLSSLYPGDAYVDWTGMDGYNFGTIAQKPDGWKTFTQVIKPTYDQLLALAPGKPITIGEIASTESGGSKAAWISDMLKTQLPLKFPRIKALAWFNWNILENGGRYDWQVESSASAQTAFADGISAPSYRSGTYGNLPLLSKVPVP